MVYRAWQGLSLKSSWGFTLTKFGVEVPPDELEIAAVFRQCWEDFPDKMLGKRGVRGPDSL